MALTTWTGDGSNNLWTNANNWDNGAPTDAVDVIIPDCTALDVPLLESTVECFSLTMLAGADINGGSGYTIEIHGEADGTGDTQAGYCIWVRGKFTNSVDIEILAGSSTNCSVTPSDSSKIRNLKVNESTVLFYTIDSLSLSGDLTVSAGTFDAQTTTLTVDETVKIEGGTLKCNDSTISFGQQILSSASYGLHLTSGTFNGGSGTHTISQFYQTGGTCTLTSDTTTMNGYNTAGGFSFKKEGGTFTQTDGTVDMTNASAGVIQLTSNPTFFNLTLSGGTVLSVYNWDTTRTINVAGNLIISAGTTFNTQYQALAANILNVTGQATLNGKLEAHDSTDGTVSDEKDLSFGSLLIESGGEYSATSGVTEITSGAHSGTWGFKNGGTYTHNKGTIKVTSTETKTHLQAYYFYNVTIVSGDSSDIVAYRDGGLPAGTSGEITILGNLTIEEGIFERDTKGDDLIVHGLVEVQSGGQFGQADESGDNTFNSLVVNGGTFATGTGANNFNGGIRALSSITSDDTITINGTGGLLEGALDDANITLNQSAHWKSADSVSNQQILGASVANLGSQSNYTIMAWVKQDSSQTDSNGTVVLSNDNFHLKINDTGYVKFEVRPGGVYTDVSTAGSYGTGWLNADDGWHHICGRWDSGTGGGTLKIFIDGVEWATRASVGSSATTAGTQAIKMISKDTNNDDQFAGQIMDVKCFNSVVSSEDILALASKMNADINLTSSASDCQVWYKLDDVTETTPQDSSGKGNNGPTGGISTNGSALTKVYDAFSVKVGKDETTTDGNLTITQGKLEGLALTSLDFSGDTQLVSCTSNTFYNGRGAFSVSAWFYHDNSHDGHLLHTIVNARDGGNDGMALSLDSTNDRVRFRIGDGSSDDLYTDNSSTTHGKWYHVVASRDASNNTAIYINGKSAATGTSSKTISISTGNFGIGGRPSATDADEFSGQIRDVGCWSYALSADQVAALYTGHYNVTPSHQYKIDEGKDSTVADTGTETAADGTITGATWVNGTLDLDGTLTVDATGFLSAPRGDLDLEADFDNYGTFTHNSGTVTFDHATNTQNINEDGTAQPTFYKLDNGQPAVGGATVVVWKSITVVHTLSQTGGRYFQFKGDQGSLTVTLGSSSVACTVTEGNRCLATLSGAGPVNIYGADQLKPFVTTTGGPNHACTEVHYKWGDLSADTFTTQHNITIDGDMKFGTTTVASGDEFDMNGQRVEFNGSVTYSGTLNVSGSLAIFHSDFTKYGTLNNADSGDIITMASSGTPTFSYITGYRTFFQNGGVQLGTGGWSNVSNAIVAGNTKVGTRNTSSETLRLVDGCVFETSGTTHTVSGNCEFGGGIIGRSVADFTGVPTTSAQYIQKSSFTDFSSATEGTIECWFNADDIAHDQAGLVNPFGDTRWNIFVNKSGSDLYLGYEWDNGGTEIYGGNAVLIGPSNSGKWHHCAMTIHETNGYNVYLDGKLVKSGLPLSNQADVASATLSIGATSYSSSYLARCFDGQIGRASVWTKALTQTQIRKMLFYDWTDLAADTGTFTATDCCVWYQFDAGTGVDVEDYSTGGSENDGTMGGTASNATWGTMGDSNFTYVDSTLDLTGTGDFVLTNGGNFKVYNLTMAAASKTTTLIHMPGSSMNVYGTHTVGAGTYTTAGTPSVTYQGTGTVSDGGAGFVANYISYWSSSTPVPAAKFRFFISDQAPTNLGGDIVCEGPSGNLGSAYFRGGGYTTNTNNYQVTTPKWVFDASTTMNIGSSTIILNSTDGLSTSSATSVLSAGPGCIITGTNAATTFKSQGHWEIVGNISNLNVTNEELAVFGKVTNCTGDIHQWLPHFEKDVILDAGALADVTIDQGDDIDRNNELLN